MDFPPSPWLLRGDLLLSLWRVGRGVVGTAFVDYQPGGVLTYRELLAARPVLAGPVPTVRITEIWVDSEASCDGGRALWAIPKELADFTAEADAWTAVVDGRQIASARFQRGRSLPFRTPVRLQTSQPRGPDTVVAPVRGTARVHRAGATWTFDADGPLKSLAGRRPFASVVLADFRLTFGD